MKKTFLCAILGLVLSLGQVANAQQQQPVAVVSVTSYTELLADITFLGELSGQADLGQNLEGMLKLFTQGKGLDGMDKARPWGAAVTTDGANFLPIAFLPVQDLDKLLTAGAAFVGQPKDAGNGVKELVSQNGQTLYVKEANGWALFAQSADSLTTPPGDPLTMLGDLPKNYDIAIRFWVQNIPAQFRELAVAQLQGAVEGGLQKEPEESDAEFAARQELVRAQVDSMRQAINEIDAMTIGWTIDRTARNSFIDLNMTAKAGTSLAEQMSAMSSSSSQYAGFLSPESAASMNFVSVITDQQKTQFQGQLETLRKRAMTEIDKDKSIADSDRETVKKVTGQLIDVISDTAKKGKMDGGARLELEQGATKIIAGGYIADGKKFNDAIMQLLELAKKDVTSVRQNAEKVNDINFHQLTIPANDEEARKMFGDEVTVYVGSGPESAFVAVGSGSLDMLKNALAAGGSSSEPMQLIVDLGSIMKFASSIEENPMVAAMAAELEKAGSEDHVRLTVKPIANGVNYRLLMESGVLKVMAQAGQMAQGM